MYNDVQQELQKQLSTNSAITALLNTWIDSSNNVYPMIINDDVCPSEWGLENATLNYYENIRDNFSDYDDMTFTVNCRAFTRRKSKDLSEAIRAELHRVNGTGSDYFFTVSITATLQPFDERDNYNTIIDINIKGR